MTIVHTPNPVHCTPNLAIAHPQSWLDYTPNLPYTPNLVNWGCNQAPHFWLTPPIWSIGAISQDWGCNQAPQLCTEPQFGPIGGISQDWGYNQAPQFCTDPQCGPIKVQARIGGIIKPTNSLPYP